MRRLGWLLALAALAAWLLTGVVEVRPGEVAVVRRFGRVLEVRPKAGLWIGLPWGIDRVDRVAVEKRRRVEIGYRSEVDSARADTPPGQMLTGDHNLVNVGVAIHFTVDPAAVVEFVVQGDRVEELIARHGEAALAEWTAGRPVDEVLLRGKTTLPADLLGRLQPRLDEARLGVRLRGVDVTHLAPPAEVKAAFDRVARAEAEVKSVVEKAREDAATMQAEAGVTLRQMRDQTRSYVESRPTEAAGEAAYFEQRWREYRASPVVREAGRWAYRVRLLSRLLADDRLQLLDPDLDVPWPR